MTPTRLKTPETYSDFMYTSLDLSLQGALLRETWSGQDSFSGIQDDVNADYKVTSANLGNLLTD